MAIGGDLDRLTQSQELIYLSPSKNGDILLDFV